MQPDLATLALRSRILQLLREFFHGRDFIEVETPVRIAAPAQETQIDSPPSGKGWLRASPELQMKRLLAHGCSKIFQLGPCFRSGECGRRHNPEFTMLEWYHTGATYLELLRETEALLASLLHTLNGSHLLHYNGMVIDCAPPWPQLTVQEAYRRWAGWDPLAKWDDERFDYDMATIIEPQLATARPTVLIDYPAQAASLARLKPTDQRMAERWELYIGGLELANAYGELLDAGVQRQRFLQSAAQRHSLGKDPYPFDEEFLATLERIPEPCSGIALGVDRLVMLLSNATDISRVRSFCQQPGALL